MTKRHSGYYTAERKSLPFKFLFHNIIGSSRVRKLNNKIKKRKNTNYFKLQGDENSFQFFFQNEKMDLETSQFLSKKSFLIALTMSLIIKNCNKN